MWSSLAEGSKYSCLSRVSTRHCSMIFSKSSFLDIRQTPDHHSAKYLRESFSYPWIV